MNKPKRGEIYWADLPKGMGSEQEGLRPVVIVQNNKGNEFSPTTIIAVVTGRDKGWRGMPTHAYLEAGTDNGMVKPSVVLCEQLKTIAVDRLKDYCGWLNDFEMELVDKALRVSLEV